MELSIIGQNVLKNLILIAILVVVPIGIKALLKFVEEKTKNIENEDVKKAIDKTKEIILDAIDETNQTYVKKLKETNGFDKDAEEEAFNATKNRVLEILNKETTDILNEEFDNVNAYINSKIEANIKKKKDLDKE